jgi:hypothetical protein
MSAEQVMTMLPLFWEPRTKPQVEALNSPAEILLFGGAAGGLKTETLLMDAVQEADNPNLNAIIFRESYPQLNDIIRKAYRLYQNAPYFGKYDASEHCWYFPINLWAVRLGMEKPVYPQSGGGARIKFSYLRNDNDVFQHQGQEYTFIGWDESTHCSEFQFRYLLSRLRSTDKSLQLRVRLATNPGGEGHQWHMDVFIGKRCWHCYPGAPDVRKPYVIYTDAKFSDGTYLEHTTQFIPSYVVDHNLFGDGNQDYIRKLRIQRSAEADALLKGCWAQFEGQYFRCWEPERGCYVDERGCLVTTDAENIDWRMVIPRGELDVQWWWSGFGGGDYGYGQSSAAFVYCVRTPAMPGFQNGRIYVIGEYVEGTKPVKEWAKHILDIFLAQRFQPSNDQPDGNPLRTLALYLDPANFNALYDSRTGTSGHSVADLTNEVLRPSSLFFQRAINDRVGGWQLIYSMLKSGELVICDNCEKLVKAIPSRIYDKKKNGDILKVPGDELDDVIDALRYAIYSFIKAAVKPAEMQIAEAMAKADSPTNAMITKRKLEAELRRKEAPVFVGAGARRRLSQWMAQQSRRKIKTPP